MKTRALVAAVVTTLVCADALGSVASGENKASSTLFLGTLTAEWVATP